MDSEFPEGRVVHFYPEEVRTVFLRKGIKPKADWRILAPHIPSGGMFVQMSALDAVVYSGYLTGQTHH